jgi:hypothetical protein
MSLRNAFMEVPASIPEGVEDAPPSSEMVQSDGAYQLKELKPKHRNILSLVAQGVSRGQIASICDITPEYVSMLCKMPICKQYIAGLNEVVALQLEGMFGKSVEAISDALDNGSVEERLKGARLQLEATKRLGRPADIVPQTSSTEERLLRLSERLTSLIVDRRPVQILDTSSTQPEEITDASFEEVQSKPENKESTQLANRHASDEAQESCRNGNVRAAG